MLTRWDQKAFTRALGGALAAFVLVFVVTVATDEGGLTLEARLGRTFPVAPVCAAVGAWIALSAAHQRGELGALESLGRSPWLNARAAAIGAVLVPLLVAVLLATHPGFGPEGFFPRPPVARTFEWDGSAFRDPAGPWRVHLDGTLEAVSSNGPTEALDVDAPSPRVRSERWAAAGATALAGIALAIAFAYRTATRTESARFVRVTLVVLTALVGGISLVFFQAAAARWVPLWSVLVGPAVLLALSVAPYLLSRGAHARRASS